MTERAFWIAFRHVDDVDWRWLLSRLDNSGEAAFWRGVISAARAARADAAIADGETKDKQQAGD